MQQPRQPPSENPTEKSLAEPTADNVRLPQDARKNRHCGCGKSAAEPISIAKWLLALPLQLSQLDLLIQQ
jgi:hypothetical protein